MQVFRTKAFPTGATTAMDIGLSNLSLKFITLSFYSTPMPLCITHELTTTATATTSYVQVLIVNLCTPLCLSLSYRSILLAPCIRHYPHLCWCCPHGRHRNCLPLYRNAHGVFCVCLRRVTMEPDANLVEKARNGNGHAGRNSILAGSYNGIHACVCEYGG